MSLVKSPLISKYDSLVVNERRLYRITKRMLDLIICILLLPFTLFLMLILSIAIRLDSPGPAFFIQERIGRGGKRFNMYKFRTMRSEGDLHAEQIFMQAFIEGKTAPNNTSSETSYKPDHHKRITGIGSILRKTSLDELPQIFNILRGEMSLVGPRPNVPWEVDAYQRWHLKRLSVLPGITGLAQVRGRSRIPFDLIVHYDIEYIQNLSIKQDILILWWTVLCVLSRRGAG